MRWALAALLLLAATEFTIRGPLRFAKSDFNDFISPYIQTRAWLQGVDPYSPQNLVALWPKQATQFHFLAADLATGSLVLKRGIPTAYPPTSFVLLTTFAWLPWPIARAVWLIVSVTCFAAMLFALTAIAGFRWRESRTPVFLALAIALAPFHTALAAGNIVIVALGLCALALLAEQHSHVIAAGVLLGIAVALKPQIGLPLLFYFLLRKQWRLVLAGGALLMLLGAIALASLAHHHAPWLANYEADNKILFAAGSLGDFTEADPLRFNMVNLQVALYPLSHDRFLTNQGALAIAFLLGVVWLVLVVRKPSPKLLEISAAVVLSLLPVYHRFSDACLLVLPLAWAIAAWKESRRSAAALVLVLVFLVPGATMLDEWSGHFGSLPRSWMWTPIVMPHQAWALLLLSCVLLFEMRYGSRKGKIGAIAAR